MHLQHLGLSLVYKVQTGFEFWVLRFRDLGASYFGPRFRVLRFRNYRCGYCFIKKS